MGAGNFETLERFLGEDKPLHSEKYMKGIFRPIYRFLSLASCQDNTAKLSKESLEEIPEQLVAFMQKSKMVPIDALHAPKEAEQFFEFQKETLFQELKKLECTEEQIEGLFKKGIPSPSAIGFLSSRADDEESYYNPLINQSHKLSLIHI
eukprot:TRINITY_DN35992_c0_g1_i1.p1 TRINITY_DN35992_c0_g1~~TRINITY_DN35992_c0_g1_i1.p1  ORF type:complete len:150 (-),score=26.90 TRINITY_DN35992_c0_g1_i1:125-574(-)